MTVALVDSDRERITFGHVGDSRAYRIREEQLDQLTDDHSLVGELIRSGKLTREEAEVHPQRSVITRALGTDPDVDVDTFVVDTEPDDIYLLCSDGLSGMVSDQAILGIVRDNRGDLQAAAKALIAAANRGGGDDNITVVVFALDGDDEGSRARCRRSRRRTRPTRAPARRRGHARRAGRGAGGRDDSRETSRISREQTAGGSRVERGTPLGSAGRRRGSLWALLAPPLVLPRRGARCSCCGPRRTATAVANPVTLPQDRELPTSRSSGR